MEKSAFEHMARTWREKALSVSIHYGAGRDEAEDIAQETLMRLWLLRDRIAPQADIEPLAVRMAKNLCVSEWRKQQVRQGQAVRVEIVAHEDIEHHVELKEEIERLRHAISLLKPAEQRLFRMRHEAEMDISQIASATGIGERSVSAMLSTAKRKLQEILTRKGGLQ